MSTSELVMMYVVGPLITCGVAYLTYLFGRRKTVAETATTELQNTEMAIGIWRKMAEDMRDQMVIRDNEVKELKAQLEKVIQQNTELLLGMDTLKKDYSKLLANYNALKKLKE